MPETGGGTLAQGTARVTRSCLQHDELPLGTDRREHASACRRDAPRMPAYAGIRGPNSQISLLNEPFASLARTVCRRPCPQNHWTEQEQIAVGEHRWLVALDRLRRR